MKKFTLLLAVFVALLLLGACGLVESSGTDGQIDVVGESESFHRYAGEATVQDFNRAYSSSPGILCATEDTVYFAENELIYYYDKASGIAAPLCGKPECNHDNADCNAYYGSVLFGLSNYDGRLYWVTQDSGNHNWVVNSCAYDGTDRQRIRELDRDIVGSILNNTYICYHRGCLYWTCMTYEVVDSVPRNIARVFAFPFNPGEEGYVILENEITDYVKIQPYLGGLYIVLNNAELIGDRLKYYLTLYRWDVGTRELEELYNGETAFFCYNQFWTMDEGILFCGSSVAANEDGTVSAIESYEYQSIVYKYWFENGEFGALYEMAPAGRPMNFAISNLLSIGYKRNDDIITLFLKDFDGNTLLDATIAGEDWLASIAPKIMGTTMLGVDENDIYYCYSGVDLSEYIVAIPLDGSGIKLLWAGDE